jgi:hypothetical protein
MWQELFQINRKERKMRGIKSNAITVAILFAISCSSPTPPQNTDLQGSANITVHIGKVGALAKRADINFAKLCVTLSVSGETTIFDTISISGNTSTTVSKTYDNLASMKTWTLTAKSLDSKDSTIHAGSTTFSVRPRQTTDVDLDLPSNCSMLKASFSPIRDSVTRCELLIDGLVVDDSAFEKQSAIGTTVQLAYDYLSVGSARLIKMDVYGEMWGQSYLLYTADTIITPLTGIDDNFSLLLEWVGPSLPPQGRISVDLIIGKTGTVLINGLLEDVNVQDGLVAYYRFIDNANDSSGNGNNGIVYGPELRSDRLGHENSAYNFIGEGDSISIPNSISLDISKSLTVAAWILPMNSDGVIVSKYAPGNSGEQQGGYSIALRNGKISIALATKGFFVDYLGVTTVSINEYHFVAGVYDFGTNTIRLFLDGILEREVTFTREVLGSNSLNILIGNRIEDSISQDGRPAFIGTIDGVRIYNRCLSSRELSLLMDHANW